MYVNVKFQEAFGVGGRGLEAWRNPSYTYTEADVMWEARAIFFHMLLGWLNIRKASDA